MADYAALKALLLTPPYDTQTDAQNAAAINALTQASYVGFSPADAMMALAITTTVDWGWLTGVADGWITSANASNAGTVAVTAGTRRIAVTIRDLFRLPLPVAVTDSNRATLIHNGLSALVTANVITQAGQNAVEALAVSTVTWPLAHGFGRDLDFNDCAIARSA